jgi:hypothetical protein
LAVVFEDQSRLEPIRGTAWVVWHRLRREADVAKAKKAKPTIAKPKKAEPKKAEPKKAEKAQEDRIDALKRRAKELSGGAMESNSDDCPAEVEESFWKYVVDYEEAPWTTNFQQLEDAGVSLPSPDTLNDEQVTIKLWEVIQKLALLQVFIEQTDHLSDRELYHHLWTDSMREETKSLAMAANAACHIQLLSGGSDEDNLLYLKFYADEDFRRQWHKDFPTDPMPEHVDPPYDRDRLLPKPDYDVISDGEPN